MININNLKEGQTIKNYKELCEILEIKTTTGGSKVKQLEELQLYCKYHNEGHKYIIDNIVETPVITLDDILKNKNNKYITLVANIILEYLYNEPTELKEIPLLRFMELLGLTNTNYKNGGRYKKELSQLYDIKIFSIYYFYSNTKNQFKQLIERCLNNLQKRSILFWTRCIVIVEKHKNDDGTYSTSTRKADKEETKEILNTQKEALEYLKIDSMSQLIYDRKAMKEFNDILNKELGYNYFYAYDVIVGDRAIKIEYDKIMKQQINKLMVIKTYNMFATDKFQDFYTDYEKLIDLCIYQNINSIETKLKDKHNENIENYRKETKKLNVDYENKKEEIENKYLE